MTAGRVAVSTEGVLVVQPPLSGPMIMTTESLDNFIFECVHVMCLSACA